MPTSMNTVRQSVTSSSWVAMIGPMALPISEIMHWKMPLFMPRRLGCEASTATATPIEATGPSASPITARISSRLTSPPTMPEKADISENTIDRGDQHLAAPDPVGQEAHRERRDAPEHREDADQVAEVLVGEARARP